MEHSNNMFYFDLYTINTKRRNHFCILNDYHFNFNDSNLSQKMLLNLFVNQHDIYLHQPIWLQFL